MLTAAKHGDGLSHVADLPPSIVAAAAGDLYPDPKMGIV